jgi:hypothetical protein
LYFPHKEKLTTKVDNVLSPSFEIDTEFFIKLFHAKILNEILNEDLFQPERSYRCRNKWW